MPMATASENIPATAMISGFCADMSLLCRRGGAAVCGWPRMKPAVNAPDVAEDAALKSGTVNYRFAAGPVGWALTPSPSRPASLQPCAEIRNFSAVLAIFTH